MRGGSNPIGRDRSIGKYRLREPLGADDRVERYLAEHVAIGRVVEVHCLAEGELASGEAASRLSRAAKVLGRATHRGLQGVVDTGRDERGRPYVVYEVLRGRPLAEIIERAPHGIEPERAARLVTQILEALRSLHEAGAVLRTLTPEDVMVETVSDGQEHVKVRAGHGAAVLEEGGATPKPSVRYSAWLAPEVRRGEPGLDPRVDLYSVGVMFRQLLTGRPAGDDEMLSDTARRALARACAELPEERFAAADGFLQAVGLLLPTSSRPPREQLPTPDDPLSADLQYLHLRRTTRHGPKDEQRGRSRLSLLVVLLTIEAIYRRFGEEVWAELTSRVSEAEALLPGSGNTPVHLEKGVPVVLFAEILSTVDAVAGAGDLSLLPSLGEQVAKRGLHKLFPDLPKPPTPEALIAGWPHLWSRIGRDGTAEVVRNGTHGAKLSVHGQGTPQLELAGLVAGILREGLRMAGARDVEIVLIASEALGDGRDLFGVEWR